MQASLEPDKSLMSSASLFHISNGSAHILPDHTPDRSCIGRWNSLSGRGTKTCALLDKLDDSFINYYLTMGLMDGEL